MRDILFKISISLFPFSLALPIPLIYSSITFAFFLIALLAKLEFKLLRSNDFWIIITAVFFLIDMIVPLFFLDFNRIHVNETKLAYFIVPFVFFNSRSVLKQNIDIIIKSFIFGVFVYVFYAWVYVGYFYKIKFPDWYDFSLIDGYILYIFYNYLPGNIHHTYIGFYIVTAISFLVKYPIKINNINISSLLVFFLSFSLFYIGGKMTMLLLFLNYILLIIFLKKIKLKYLIIIAVLQIIGFLFVRDWVVYSLESSFSKRIDYYKCGLEILKDNFINGVGAQNIKASVKYCSNLEKFIPHNSMLFEAISNGVLGMLLMLTIYITLIYIYVKSNNFAFKIMIINVLLLGLIEDVFYVQRGVLFIVIFISLFLYTQKEDITRVNKHNYF